MAGPQFRQTMSPTEAFMRTLMRRGYTEREAVGIMRFIDIMNATNHPLLSAAQLVGLMPNYQIQMELFAARRVSTAVHDILERWDEVAANRHTIFQLTQYQATMMAEFAREVVPPGRLVPRREK